MTKTETDTEILEKEGPSSETLVKEGYKKTKLGWIPEEWSIKKLNEFGSFSKGKGISKSDIKKKGRPCVLYGDLYTKHKDHIKSFSNFIDQETAEKSHQIKNGDLLFAGSGETAEEIGMCAAYLDDDVAYAGGDIIVFTPQNNDSWFLGYLMNHKLVNRQMYKLAQGYSVVHLYLSHLKQISVPLPPLPEQKKIAETLSAWDRTIEILDQLIAKKEEFKKGLMQQLLTGKKRFPGFEGEWREVKLGSLVNTFSGGTPSRSKFEYYDGNIPWIKSGELNSRRIYSTEENISAEGLENSSAKFVNKNTLLLAIYGATAGVISVNMMDKASINQAVLALIPKNDKIDQGFLELWFSFNKDRIVHTFTQGGQPNLSAKIVKSLKIECPEIEEQRKISKLLFSISDEIECLKKKVKAINTQKKGLMQQLLMGKTRVVL